MQKESPSSKLQRGKGRPRAFDRDTALLNALKIFWQHGYEPASIAELCQAMGIKPPSLYAAFGNKAKLFLEAVQYYETVYWDDTWDKMDNTPDIYESINEFFCHAAKILLSPDAPCGCLVVLAAINVSADSQDVFNAIKKLRQEGKDCFQSRIIKAMEDNQLPHNTDAKGLALTLNTLLEGMSIQARDGTSQKEMMLIGSSAVRLLPIKS